MPELTTGQRVAAALDAAGLSQRAVADETGIPQTTLSRIVSGNRSAKVPELLLIAQATGHTYAQLTGTGITEDKVRWAARSTNGAGMESMKAAILHFMALDAYLDDQAIPAA